MSSTHLSLHVHCVFATKHRERCLPTDHLDRIHKYIGGMPGKIDAISNGVGGVEDHVHMLIGLKASHRLCDVIREVKARSSAWIADNFLPGFKWQEGYGAFTFGAPDLDAVRQYVEEQQEHHRVKTFQEEYVAMLKRGMVEYDERYLW